MNLIQSPTASFVLSLTQFAGDINGSLAPLNAGGNWQSD